MIYRPILGFGHFVLFLYIWLIWVMIFIVLFIYYIEIQTNTTLWLLFCQVALWNSNLGPTLNTFRLRGLCVMETVMAALIQRLAFPGSHYYCLSLTCVALRSSSAFLSNLFKDNEHAFLTNACNARCWRSLVCLHVGYIRSQCKTLDLTIVFLFYAQKICKLGPDIATLIEFSSVEKKKKTNYRSIGSL